MQVFAYQRGFFMDAGQLNSLRVQIIVDIQFGSHVQLIYASNEYDYVASRMPAISYQEW
jgi:hypothetical protein